MAHNGAMDFSRVDLWTPWILYWTAAVAAVAGVALVVAGAWRAHRHRRFAASTGRNQDVRLLRDTRTQRRVGMGFLAVTGLLLGLGVWLHLSGLAGLRENLVRKYGYTAVEGIRQSGSGFTADLTTADGTVLEDELVLLEPTGEPLVGEDIFYDLPGGR